MGGASRPIPGGLAQTALVFLFNTTMSNAHFESTLATLGFTGQEAALYRALLEHGDLNGYEAAKETGISRSNAYHALASLVEKGFADRIEGESLRYAALPVQDLSTLLRRRTESAMAQLARSAPARKTASAPFLSVTGRDKVLEKMGLLIDTARDRVYLSAAADDLDEIRQPLESALARGIRVTVLSNRSWRLEGAVCLSRRKPRGQIRLIADGNRVLTGELNAAQAACVLSENVHLVSLIKDSLTQEIELVRTHQTDKDDSP